jgi:asparagine synthase (glutamine-hydrolysing)
MCGIIGLFQPIEDVSIEFSSLQRHLYNRGPDASCAIQDGNIILGHSLLSIREHGRKQQPFETDESIVVFNGEIYNFDTLQNIFSMDDITSEVALIAELYERYGTDFFRRLYGEFAIAIWDKISKKLILTRDFFGTKPLYYYVEDQCMFASEISAILETPFINKQFNTKELYDILTFGGSLEKTGYSHIYKVQPGEVVTIDENLKVFSHREILRFRTLDSEHQSYNQTSFAKETERILNKSIKKRLLSDKEIAISLSGGLDSSLISILAKGKQTISTVSLNLEPLGKKYSEGIYQKQAIELLDLPNSIINVTEKNLQGLVHRTMQSHTDCTFHPTMFADLLIAEHLQKRGIRVLLTGDGADELFMGYDYYRQLLRTIESDNPLEQFQKNKDIFLNPEELYGIYYTYKNTGLFYFSNHFFFTDDVKKHLTRISSRPTESTLRYYSHMDQLSNYSQNEFHFKIPMHLDFKDHIYANHQIEVRYPMLDRELVEFALSLPAKERMKHGETKSILKNTCTKLFPRNICFKEKTRNVFSIARTH